MNTTHATPKLHILDAGGVLGAWCEEVRSTFPSALQKIQSHLSVHALDVVVYASSYVIPELGMNGYAESGHLLHMKLDPNNKNLETRFDQTFESLLAHESHHCIRSRTVGYGQTMREALVSEGLACRFELEVTGRNPIYAEPLNNEELRLALQRMAPFLDVKHYDHPSWFFGNVNMDIPRHYGYRVGAMIVANWQARLGLTAGEAVNVLAAEIPPRRDHGGDQIMSVS